MYRQKLLIPSKKNFKIHFTNISFNKLQGKQMICFSFASSFIKNNFDSLLDLNCHNFDWFYVQLVKM